MSNAYKNKGIPVIDLFIYMLLSVENRGEIDLLTCGEIFYLVSDKMTDITLTQAFHLLMQLFLDTIPDKLSLTKNQLDS